MHTKKNSMKNLFIYHFFHFSCENFLWLASGSGVLTRKIPLSNTHAHTRQRLRLRARPQIRFKAQLWARLLTLTATTYDMNDLQLVNACTWAALKSNGIIMYCENVCKISEKFNSENHTLMALGYLRRFRNLFTVSLIDWLALCSWFL